MSPKKTSLSSRKKKRSQPDVHSHDLTWVVQELCAHDPILKDSTHACYCKRPLPSREAISQIIEELRTVFFTGYTTHAKSFSDDFEDQTSTFINRVLKRLQPIIKEQVHRSLCYSSPVIRKSECTKRTLESHEITDKFFKKLPEVQKLLKTDVKAAYEGDPAATSMEEAILCYPGIVAITHYRLAHEFYKLGVALIPRMITELAHSKTGIDIHPGAVIGESFFIDHGTGVVIGETSVIGNRVRLYQGVTLGAKSFPLDERGKPVKGVPRHPIVEDDVIIYSEATILGRIVIGRGSMIGGNVWLTHSVSPGSRITQAEARQSFFENGEGI